MILGTILGFYQVIKYLLFAVSLSKPTVSFLFMIMALGVPVLAYYIQRRFREKYSPVAFPFFLSWMVAFLTMIYSVVLSIVVCYLILEFADTDGTFFTLLSNQMLLAAQTYESIEGVDEALIEQMNRLAKALVSMSPLTFVKMLIPTAFSTGNIIAFIVAALTTKSIRSIVKKQ